MSEEAAVNMEEKGGLPPYSTFPRQYFQGQPVVSVQAHTHHQHGTALAVLIIKLNRM